MAPRGDERLDILAGVISSVIANVNRPKGQKPFKPDDFIPKFEEQVKEQTEEEMMQAAQMLAAYFKGN